MIRNKYHISSSKEGGIMTLKFFKCSQCGSVAVKVYDA